MSSSSRSYAGYGTVLRSEINALGFVYLKLLPSLKHKPLIFSKSDLPESTASYNSAKVSSPSPIQIKSSCGINTRISVGLYEYHPPPPTKSASGACFRIKGASSVIRPYVVVNPPIPMKSHFSDEISSDENNAASSGAEQKLFDQENNQEEDFEIPAFLRRQKF
jgi:hypothetical protein